MNEALLLVQFFSTLVTTGVNLMPVLQKVSDLITARHAEGKTFTQEDLMSLLDEGDEIEAAARKQFADTLADPNTPKLS